MCDSCPSLASYPYDCRLTSSRSATLSRDISVATTTPTAMQIEMRVVKAKDHWQTPLTENSVTQLPRETDRLYSMAGAPPQRSTNPISAVVEEPLPPASPSVQVSKSMQTPMSPSVYSRNTDGVSIFPNDSVISFGNPYDLDRTHQGGSAVILTSQSVRSYVIGTPSPKRSSSARSSRDWKAWLSHEVSGIEAASQEDITIQQKYATPSEKHRRNATQTFHTSQIDSDDATVILRKSLETCAPRAVSANSAALGIDEQIPQPPSSDNDLHLTGPVRVDRLVIVDASKKPALNRTPIGKNPPSTPTSPTVAYAEPSPSLSTPGSSSTSTQVPFGTPTSARMNERFPFIVKKRRSNSNNSSRSHLSKSPTNSVESSSKKLNTSFESKAVYSTTFLSRPTSGSANVHGGDARIVESTWKSKENITPPMNASVKRPNLSPLRVIEQLESLQPLSLAALGRMSISLATLPTKVADASPFKHASSPVETVVTRPSLRVTIHPLSPEKLSRRPRSAFDLRQSLSPRPASKFRRPAVQQEIAGHQPTPEEKMLSNGLHHVSPRESSVTPGQRMAERFLEERKSATVLERGVRKSTGNFVREDTPAFL